MMRRKNLERAVVLGLLLSTSVYGSVSAASVDVADFVNGKTGAITVKEDTTVIGDGRQNGDSDTIGNSLFSYVDGVRYNNTVTVSNGVALQFDNVALNNAVITSDGKLTINANIDGMRAGLYLDANVKADELVIDASANGAKGIYAYNADRNNVNNGNIFIDVEKNVQVKSNADGIYTEADKDNDIDINAAGLTVVTDSRGGIYNNIGENNHIRIDVGDGTVSVTSGDTTGKYGSIINKNSGDTTIDAGTIIINADTSNGVYATDGTINLNAKKDNQINGQVGIKAEGGTVNVTATNGNNIITANTNGIYASGENSVVNLIGNVNKITVNGTDKTTKNNAILAENNSTVNIVDGGNLELNLNKTPYYIDDPAAGDNVSGLRNYGSNLNINTDNGFVDINVVSNTVKHMSESTGISLNTWATTDGANYGDATTTISGKYVDINVSNNIQNVSENIVTSGAVYGIHLNDSDKENEKRANLTLTANGYYTDTINEEERNIGINIIANNDGYASDPNSATAVGVKLNGNAEAVITANSGDVNISANSKISYGYGIQANGYANSATNLNITGVNTNINGNFAAIFTQGSLGENTETKIKINATGGNNNLEGTTYGILSQYGAKTELKALNGYNYIKNMNSGIYTTYNTKDQSEINLTALGNTIETTNYGICSDNGKVKLTATGDDSVNEINAGNYGIYSLGKGEVYLTANENDNIVSGSKDGIISNNGIVKLDAGNNNRVTSDTNAVYAYTNADIDLTVDENNTLYAGEILTDQETQLQYGKAYAVKALSGSIVTLDAGNANDVYGAVYANGTGTDEEGKEVSTNVVLDSANNIVKSYAVITGAGDLDQDKTGVMKDAKVISALYAEEGATVNVTGENYIGTYAVSDDPDLERTVWAYKNADINIDGATTIKTDNYAKATNSKDIAIAAGTAVNLDYETVTKPVDLENRATVNINYENYSSDNSISYISGDILSAYEGLVNINAKEGSNAGIKIEGNLLAGNNGILNVDLGKGGVLIGRADDYGDAGVINNAQAGEANEHQEFYNPAFSSNIYQGGRVDIDMGAGSTWYVTGQSWITTIDTFEADGDTQAERAKIDLVTEYKDKDGSNIAAHALTVYDFKGDADFLMNLSGNRADTDMLYMKHADGNYRIMLDQDITTNDINQDSSTGANYNGLRFATVGADSNVTFTVGSYDNGGAFNVEYEVGKDVYGSAETAHENEAYNGTELNGGKPGDNMVDNFFGSDGKPVTDGSSNEGGISTASANGIMLMNEEVETFADEENNANKYNAINHKIIAIKDTELNDTGETILNMSRANYSNAIYMDRLNKRLGEARYINGEEDEGMWVRIRHDRIGKDDAYRSQNTMYELGYDKKQDCDNGERRVGFAVDYMHGDTGYTDIAGKGEIDRYGLWLYDTWMGDKGHYVDYVAKWGHLDNDFEVYTMRDGNKVTGDYSNNVFSVSAEYGRKKDIGNDWYFEPQAQLQLARVTGADYTTNQGTKVSVDGINSLIGRAGFRIGKDFGEEKQSTLYFKADVLHEFLGDQDVYVMDKSTDNKWAGISYDNEGTWYDIGIGYAAMMSKSSYAFIDLEQSFGNDNDDTYQINAGVRWTF